MAVAIAQPNQQPQKDPLERLANAVNIAKTVYGIYTDNQTLDLAREKAKTDAIRADEDAAYRRQLTEKTGLEIDAAKRTETINKESDDPNSPLSQMARKAAKAKGLTLPETVSATQVRTMFDAFIKPQNASGTNGMEKQHNQNFQKVTQALESIRGNPAVQQAERDIYAADKAHSLANLYGDPNKLSQAQVHMLAAEIGKIAQGGVPTIGELENITPQTLTGRLSKVSSNLMNDPTPANAAAFVKQYQDYAESLKRDAQHVIKDRYGRIINTNARLLSADDLNILKDQYINRFESDTSGHGAGKPKTVIQDGHTYILNEKTGQYE